MKDKSALQAAIVKRSAGEAHRDLSEPAKELLERPSQLAAHDGLGATQRADAEQTTPRALVAIDRDGNVISPLRRYAGRAAAYGALGLLGTIGIYTLAAGDPLVMALSLVGTAAWGHGILVTHWLERASALMLRGELDTAETLLRRCLRPPWGSEAVRAHAHLRLSGIFARRGDHAAACEEAQRAAKLFSAEYPPQPQFVLLARYHEIRSLVSARRQPDARCLLEELGPPPLGDYLRAQHYLTELYVALGDDRMPFLDGPLWERTDLALRTPPSGALLGLCAWGYYKLGDLEMAVHLGTLADKRRDEPLEQTMPLLARWLAGFIGSAAGKSPPVESGAGAKEGAIG
jgi:tetratricopeptide (TPR) repeat protein